MPRSYSLEHERGEQLEPLLRAYRDAVNQILGELWGALEWEKRRAKGGKTSGGSNPSTRWTSTARSTRRSSGTAYSRVGLMLRTGWTPP